MIGATLCSASGQRRAHVGGAHVGQHVVRAGSDPARTAVARSSACAHAVGHGSRGLQPSGSSPGSARAQAARRIVKSSSTTRCGTRHDAGALPPRATTWRSGKWLGAEARHETARLEHQVHVRRGHRRSRAGRRRRRADASHRRRAAQSRPGADAEARVDAARPVVSACTMICPDGFGARADAGHVTLSPRAARSSRA